MPKEQILFISRVGGYVDEYTLEQGAGGSETWLIQLSREFKRKGYKVSILTYTKDHIDPFGIRWISIDNMDRVLSFEKFDHIIISRQYSGIVKKIRKFGTCDNVILQVHDLFMENNDRTVIYEDDEEIKDPIFKYVGYLSDSHKEVMRSRHHIIEGKLAYLPNGIDENYFRDVSMDHEIDHRILFSSAGRGVEIVAGPIAEEVRKTIPDFGVDVCFPVYWNQKIGNSNGVRFLGTLSKKDLYSEMKKHACWVYPSTFNETFCISAVEAAMSGNDLILPLINGPKTTFSKFENDISMKNLFTYGNLREAVKEASQRIINSIENYHKQDNISLRKRIQQSILENYTWKNAVERYEKLWNRMV